MCCTAMKNIHTDHDPDFAQVHGLATEGIFAVTRNPMYVAFVFVVPAAAVLTDNLWMLVLAPVVPIYFEFVVIPTEEVFLEKLFGKAYVEYCERAPRWLLVY